jgi:hypothetical protein
MMPVKPDIARSRLSGGSIRARLPGTQIRNRDWPGVPSLATAHSRTCHSLLYRPDPLPRDALAPGGSEDSPVASEWALEQLRRIQHHIIRLNRADTPVSGISKLNVTQTEVFDVLRLKKPTEPQQLTLL